MKIVFPSKQVVHKRKKPRTSIYMRSPYFGTKGVVLDYRQAMAVYYKVQDFLDHWDVENEIEYHEKEREITKEQARGLRAKINGIVDDYRAALDDDGHWNDVLMDVLHGRVTA